MNRGCFAIDSMETFAMNTSRLLLVLFLILVGMESRLILHPPNCTAINAVALFSAYSLGNRPLSFLIVFSSIFLSDIALGWYSVWQFVYLAYALIILLGYQLKREITITRLSLASLSSSFLFFFIANFGVWLEGFLYPQTAYGLACCYLAALPFLLNQMLGDLFYGIILFGSAYIWQTRFQTEREMPNCFAQKMGNLG